MASHGEDARLGAKVVVSNMGNALKGALEQGRQKKPAPLYATDYLEESNRTLTARGKDYHKRGSDAQAQQERSFAATAAAYNAITGQSVTPAEVCLMLQILKDVRQWSQPDRLHRDSVLDCVGYAALKAEELEKQHVCS